MKIKYLCVMCVAGCMAINSCSLEEENPSGGPTVEEYWSTPEGYEKLINGCYYPMSRPLFGGGEDYHLFWAEAGTDLWQGPQGDGWMSPAFTYVGLNAGDGSLGEIWKGPYEGINYCMAAIEFADKSGLPEDEKNAKVAEAYFLRAYYNLILVEHFGGVYLPETYTQEIKFDVPRSSVADFYTRIFSDLKFAMTYLPTVQTEIGRPIRAAAYHLYVKACLQRAPYDDVTSEEKQDLYIEARDKALAIINNENNIAPGIELYDKVGDIFAVENNKNNKEAIWKVTHSTISSLNANTGYWNRIYKQFGLLQENLCGVIMNIDSMPKCERRIMPTRYMLDLYEPNDKRYEAFFREKYYANEDYTWTEADCNKLGKSLDAVGKTIKKGEVALLFTRKSVPDKDERKEAVVDIDMIYDENGKTTTIGQKYYPVLKKLEVPGMYQGQVTKSYTSADNIIYRLADTYLLAAEAWFRLGNTKEAKKYIDEIRNRACNYGGIMTPVEETDIDDDFILDERARELVGEHTRWMDLKRFRRLKERAEAHNPYITSFDENVHYLRPIPDSAELDYHENPGNFQNPGY